MQTGVVPVDENMVYPGVLDDEIIVT